jgi:CheY-like chemotaxis protein/HPt (histidine-containing phosphotransfer) domain-containing protein
MQPHSESLFDARLLLAEDNPFNQDIATRILEHMGCRIVTAENGVVAERLLTQEKFDLVLMDCEMPELDGYEVTRRFRTIERRTAESEGRVTSARVPVVALTAHAEDDMRQKCLAAGMDDLLVKPFKKAQISQTLRRWIGNLERPAGPQESGSIGEKPDVNVAKHAAPDNSPIDRAIVDDFLESKGEAGIALMRRLLLRFMETAPASVASLQEKYQAQQPEDIWRLAHSLRSSAAALGARHLSHRLAGIEKSAREHGLENLQPILALLETDLAATLENFQSLIGEFDVRAR